MSPRRPGEEGAAGAGRGDREPAIPAVGGTKAAPGLSFPGMGQGTTGDEFHGGAAPPPSLLRGAALFLDFDGTLVEIAGRPDAVVVDADLRALLLRLVERLDGRVALVSGRSIEQILNLLGDLPVAMAGSHGLEFREPGGRRWGAVRPAALDEVQAAMLAFAERQGGGVLVEPKPLGAALHFREAPHARAGCEVLAMTLAERHGLHLQTGKMMFEVRVGGGDKGSAIRALMREPGLAGGVPIFLGDDDTDEPGFAAVAAVGGAGVLVGPARASAARYRLAGVGDTLDWLARAAGALA